MTLTNERLFDNIEIAKIILDYFIKKPELYDYYKMEVLVVEIERIKCTVLEAHYRKIGSKQGFYLDSYGTG